MHLIFYANTISELGIKHIRFFQTGVIFFSSISRRKINTLIINAEFPTITIKKHASNIRVHEEKTNGSKIYFDTKMLLLHLRENCSTRRSTGRD